MPNNTKLCSFEGCEKKVKSRGLCGGHYLQRHTRGQQLRPLGRRSHVEGMTLHERFEHYVDRSGECHVWAGPTNDAGYGLLSVGDRKLRAHRVAYEWAHGPIPDGLQVDHMCYNRACVNVKHLRVVTNKQNNENRSGANADNQSGYRNVHFYPRDNKWHAQVTNAGKKYHLGYFDDVHEAGAAAKAKRLELFTHSDGR